MQHFEQFQRVCEFFVMAEFDPGYERMIDVKYRQTDISPEIEEIVHAVKSFHEMRQQLSGKIYDHVPNHALLNDMIRAQKVEQYHKTPDKSICALTGEPLKDGILCVLCIDSEMKLFTVHKRFKRILYNFWILIHFPEQIILDIRNWLNTQTWWRRGQISNAKEILQRIISHKENIFFKKAYIKMKDIGHYIQNEMTATPINVRHTLR